jgi:membrane protein
MSSSTTQHEAAAKAAPATLKEIVKSPKAVWELARDSVTAWIDDYAPSMGAAISYYTVFSIAPLLLIVISIAGLVLGSDAASGRIFAQLEGLLGPEGAAAIQGMVKSASTAGKGTFGTIAGIVTMLIGATTVFNELQSALDRIWRAPAAEKKEGIWTLIRTRFLSFGLILAIGFLLLVSLIASAAISAIGDLWSPSVDGGWEVAFQVINFVVSVAIVTVLFALIYKYLPRAKIGWHDVWIGAGVTALLFTIGKTLIGLYIGKSGVVSGFGAAGSIVVVLLWVYYSGQIFLLGAEFTWLYAYRFGSRRGEEPEPATVGKGAATGERARQKTTTTTGPLDTAPAGAAVLTPQTLVAGIPEKKVHWAVKAGGAIAAAAATGVLLEYGARKYRLIGPRERRAYYLRRMKRAFA